MKRSLFTLLLALCATLAAASPTAAPIRAEIDALLGRLLASSCQFERNGSMYSAADARDHILRKLDYIEGRRTLQSTEQFIELAASRSSSSGQPYHVKCSAEAAVESQLWLNRQLVLLRSAAAKGKP